MLHLIFMDCVALAKPGDNALGNVRPSICLFVRPSICVFVCLLLPIPIPINISNISDGHSIFAQPKFSQIFVDIVWTV